MTEKSRDEVTQKERERKNEKKERETREVGLKRHHVWQVALSLEEKKCK